MNSLEIFLGIVIALLVTLLVLKSYRLEETQEKFLKSKSTKKKLQKQHAELLAQKDSIDQQFKAFKTEHHDVLAVKESLKTKQESIQQHEKNIQSLETIVHDLVSKIDLYQRVEWFIDVGLFDTPKYLFETSERFAQEIKLIREEQKKMIKNQTAIHHFVKLNLIAKVDRNFDLADDHVNNNKLVTGQDRLMLLAFNLQCDFLIDSINPANFSKTIERIAKAAADIEKHSAFYHCGFAQKYIELKMKECKLQYQCTLKKKEEKEEQALIREQIREEQKAIKEYEKAVKEAEKQEKMHTQMLEKAKKELATSSEAEKAGLQAKIELLAQQLQESESKHQRAQSMAEQTKKGHVYVISNIGSFGEGVYKIGMTRRLDPMDRVKELGDASVPFLFDVHAIIYTDDSPKLERTLHKKFHHKRVNSVNLRKEFFRVNLDEVKEAIIEHCSDDVEFTTTIAAEEYYQSLRLKPTS